MTLPGFRIENYAIAAIWAHPPESTQTENEVFRL